MRITVDLPDDLLQQVSSIARDTSRTLSETIADLVRRGLELSRPATTTWDEQTGLPVVHTGRVITTEDVSSLEDVE